MPIDQKPQTRTQVINRDTTDTTGIRDVAGAGNELAGFRDFFGRASDIVHQAQEKEEMRLDDEALLQLDLAAKANPDKAREAVRTGDYSGFVGQERAARKYFLNSAPAILGRAIGIRESKDFNLRATSLAPPGNLQAFAREHIKAATKGMNPRGAAAYQAEIEKSLPGLQRQRDKAMADFTRTETIANTKDILRSDIANGELKTYNDVKKMYLRSATAMAGTPVLEAQVALQSAVDREIIRMSATEKDEGKLARLFALMNEPDEEGDGLTLLERNREDYDKVVNNAIANQKGILTSSFLEFESQFGIKLAAASKDPAKLAQLSAELTSAAGNYMSHTHPRYMAMQESMVRAIGKATESGATVRAALNGRPLNNKQRNEALNTLVNQGSAEAFAVAARYGASPEYSQRISLGITSGDPDVIIASLGEVSSVLGHADAGTYGPGEYIKDKKALAIYTATLGASEDQIRAMLPNLTEKLKNFNEEVDGNFGRRFNHDSNAKSRALVGTGGYASFLREKLASTPNEELEAMGLPGLEGGNLKNISAEVMRHMVDMLDVASIAAGGGTDKEGEQLWSYFKNIAQNDFAIGMESGQPIAVLNKTPRVLVGGDGAMKNVSKWNVQNVTDFGSHMSETYGLDGVGIVHDKTSTIDGSALVTFDTDETSALPMAFGYSSEFTGPATLPPEIATMGEDGMVEGPIAMVLGPATLDEEGRVVATIKRPGDLISDNPDIELDGDEGNLLTEEFLIDHTTKLKWNREAKTWEVRALAGPRMPREDAPLEEWEAFGKTMANNVGLEAKMMQALSPRERQEAFAEAGHPSTQTIEELEEQLTVQPAFNPDGSMKTAGSGPQAVVEELNRRRALVKESQVTDAEREEIMRRQDAADAKRARDIVMRRENAEALKFGTRTARGREIADRANQWFFSLFGEDRPPTPKSSSINSGMPVPAGYGSPGSVPVATAEERERAINDVVNQGVDRGMFSATAANAGKDALPEDRIAATAEATMAEGGTLDDLADRVPSQFMQSTVDFIQQSEGWVPHVYPDVGNGQPTIGYGFSLDRSDAEPALKAMGAPSVKELKAGATIEKEHAAKLAEYAVQELAIFIKKHWEGVPLAKHQLKALISMGYSSRHEKKPSGLVGPTLFGPKLTKAIRARDWEAAADEIEFNSMAGVKAKNYNGIKARRRLEAQMFRGLNDQQ